MIHTNFKYIRIFKKCEFNLRLFKKVASTLGRPLTSHGATKKTPRGDKLGLAPIFKTVSFSLVMFIEKRKSALALHTLCGLLKMVISGFAKFTKGV